MKNRPTRISALGALLLLGLATGARAGGTPAGTLITSQASVSWTQSGQDRSGVSNTLALPVHEVLDFALAWADAAEVPVYAGDVGAPLAFRLQNTGNGRDTYHLTAITALAGDDFDPDAASIHFDSDADGAWDPTRDDPYIAGANDPDLGADEAVTVFLVGQVPGDTTAPDRAHLKLAVGSALGYGTPGTVVHGAGDSGTDAIIGPGGGFAEATGTVRLVDAHVALVKHAVVASPTGRVFTTGTVDTTAIITYTIDVTVSGAGAARQVVVTDPVPSGTVYRPGSLTLNDIPLTDTVDTDAGDVGATSAGTVTVALGDLTADTPTQRISFQVDLE